MNILIFSVCFYECFYPCYKYAFTPWFLTNDLNEKKIFFLLVCLRLTMTWLFGINKILLFLNIPVNLMTRPLCPMNVLFIFILKLFGPGQWDNITCFLLFIAHAGPYFYPSWALLDPYLTQPTLTIKQHVKIRTK